MQVLDQASNEWLCVEEHCTAGKEFVVFGGKALEKATGEPAMQLLLRWLP
jgi:hypothetical protein